MGRERFLVRRGLNSVTVWCQIAGCGVTGSCISFDYFDWCIPRNFEIERASDLMLIDAAHVLRLKWGLLPGPCRKPVCFMLCQSELSSCRPRILRNYVLKVFNLNKNETCEDGVGCKWLDPNPRKYIYSTQNFIFCPWDFATFEESQLKRWYFGHSSKHFAIQIVILITPENVANGQFFSSFLILPSSCQMPTAERRVRFNPTVIRRIYR